MEDADVAVAASWDWRIAAGFGGSVVVKPFDGASSWLFKVSILVSRFKVVLDGGLSLTFG